MVPSPGSASPVWHVFLRQMPESAPRAQKASLIEPLRPAPVPLNFWKKTPRLHRQPGCPFCSRSRETSDYRQDRIITNSATLPPMGQCTSGRRSRTWLWAWTWSEPADRSRPSTRRSRLLRRCSTSAPPRNTRDLQRSTSFPFRNSPASCAPRSRLYPSHNMPVSQRSSRQDPALQTPARRPPTRRPQRLRSSIW